MQSKRRICRAGALILLAATVCPAQIWNFGSANYGAAGLGAQPGLRLHQVSTFAGYSSSGLPFSGTVAPVGNDAQYGGAATFGWQGGRTWNRSLIYTGSYLGSARFSGLNSANHALSLNTTWHATPTVSLGFSASASDSNLDNFLMAPSVLRTVASLPATFDDLAASMLAGRYTNDELASLLTGAPVLESPARSVVFGNRMLSAGAAIHLLHAPSRRLSFDYSLSGARAQHLNTKLRPETAQSYLATRSTSAGAALSMYYSLTLRTTLGVNLSTNRTFSLYSDAYQSSGSLSLGRTLSRRLVAKAHAGVGYITPVKSLYNGPRRTQPLFGGNLAFKERRYTVMLTHDRTIGDVYGLGSGSTFNTSAAWNWTPNRTWSLFSSAGQMQMQFQPGRSVNGWLVSAGATRNLTRGAGITWQYAYIRNYAGWMGNAYDFDRHTVALSFTWQPDSRSAR